MNTQSGTGEGILNNFTRAARSCGFAPGLHVICRRFSLSLMPHSHQGLNTFKSCLVKHSLNLFPS